MTRFPNSVVFLPFVSYFSVSLCFYIIVQIRVRSIERKYSLRVVTLDMCFVHLFFFDYFLGVRD